MQQFFNNRTSRLIDDLKNEIKQGSKLSIAASCFSIYAYENLKKELNKIDELRFVFTSPTFVGEKDEKEKREFYIPRIAREKSLYGTEFEIRLRNQMNQKAISKECADWIRKKVKFKTNISPGSASGVLNIDDNVSYYPLNGFTTSDLGTEKSNDLATNIAKIEAPNTESLINYFEELWNKKEVMIDITDKILEQIELVYEENSPEFIYMLTLYHIFSEFLEDIEDNIPNEATGFKESQVWNMLYSFQKDASLAIIHKLEKFNGCILADSVGLGKTFTALSVIKYYENRNKSVLVLCPKKLSDNWMDYKGNYLNNPLINDRLRYDVLFHTDLSRETGYSNGFDLSRINWGNYDLVVIDESHNFRNGSLVTTDKNGLEHYNRYATLMNNVIKSGVKTKVLMLSATPVNNRFLDLKNQLELAYEGVEENINQKLKTQKPLSLIFNNAQRVFNSWSELPPEERTTERLLSELDFDFFEVLDSVTIARSRKHIEKYYNMEEIGKFPTRLPPINQSPALTNDKNIQVNYESIFKALDQLNLSIYTPSKYIFPSHLNKYETKYSKHIKTGLSLAGRESGLKQLMAVNLLKRLESSVHSFKITITKILEQITKTITAVNNHTNSKLKDIFGSDFSGEFDEELSDIISNNGKYQIDFNDMDCTSWLQDLEADKAVLESLLSSIRDITPDKDEKLQTLKRVIEEKIKNPINQGNRKVLIFTAFADTAEYLYNNISNFVKSSLGLNSAVITGSTEGKTTADKLQANFNTILTCFSPISKARSKLNNILNADIDILIATDCISEGQNLQDCDYLINFDIHWNPVRIIQRFGRIDRIGSQNDKIQLVNFWPDIKLDEYINLKNRIETRMKITVMTSTGEDNPIDDTEKGDLEYRRKQLEKLQKEVVDPEEVSGGVSIMDLGLNEFRLDLIEYRKQHHDIEHSPLGMHSVVLANDSDLPEGVIYILKNVNAEQNINNPNRLHPFYTVYIQNDGTIKYNHLEPHKLFSCMRLLCKGVSTPQKDLYRIFNEETKNGFDMHKYSKLLGQAIGSIIEVQDESQVDSLFSEGATTFSQDEIKGLEDFELITFLVLKKGGNR